MSTLTTDDIAGTDMDTIASIIADATAGRPDIGAHLSIYGRLGIDPDRTAVLELTRADHDLCDGCGQPLDTVRPGPVDWVDQRTGESQGGWSWQHGCGAWNTPQSVCWDLDVEDLTPALAQARVEDMVRELDAIVAASAGRDGL